MKQETSKKVGKVLAIVLAVLLLVGAIGLIFALTNGFTEDFKEFYLTYGDEKIMAQESKRDFKNGETYTFGVKYVLDTGITEPKDYSVKIVSNAEKTFSYTVDGQTYAFKGGEDYSSAFSLKKDEGAFTFTIPKEGLTEAISKHHSGKAVEVKNPDSLKDGYFFSVLVTSYNEKASCTVRFKLLTSVTGVEFDQKELLF